MSVFLNKDDVLKEMFPTVTDANYWHYVAKNHTVPIAYTKPKVWEVAEKLRGIYGDYRFNAQESQRGFTPLHVAVIRGNVAAVHFFLSQGADGEILDHKKKQPLDYLEEGSSKQMEMLLQVNSSVRKIFSPFFSKDRTILPLDSFLYQQGTHDFGLEIRKIRFARPINLDNPAERAAVEIAGVNVHYIAHNIRELSRKLEIELTETSATYCVRDYWIRISDSQGERSVACLISDKEIIDKAVERSISYSVWKKRSSLSLVGHQFFCNALGFPAHPIPRKVAMNDGLNACGALGFYFEGGNYFCATSQEREKHLFVGEESLHIIFKQPSARWTAYQKEQERLMTEKEVRDTLEEMYYQGLLQPSPGMDKGIFTAENRNKVWPLFGPYQKTVNPEQDLKGLAEKVKMITPFDPSSAQIKEGREIAAKYVMQKRAVKEQLAESFQVSIENMHFLPQLGYHLDTFMRPGPKGSFFVQDYGLTGDVIQQVLQHKLELGLTFQEIETCKNYLEVASTCDRKLRIQLKEVRDTLAKAKFAVLKAPGVFYDTSPTQEEVPTSLETDHLLKTNNINFLNSITGYSQKTGRFYYIASGAQVGEENRLGTILMQIFREYLKGYVPDIDVCYVGGNSEKINDFSEGTSLWNKLSSQFGPHCLSVEEETRSHEG